MIRSVSVVLLGTAMSVVGFSQENNAYECTMGSLVRRVEVFYEPGRAVPCEVRYTKDGATEVLWSAQNESGYCETRTTEFVARLGSLGWQCSRSTAAAPPAGAAEDDTAVLSAPE